MVVGRRVKDTTVRFDCLHIAKGARGLISHSVRNVGTFDPCGCVYRVLRERADGVGGLSLEVQSTDGHLFGGSCGRSREGGSGSKRYLKDKKGRCGRC